MASWLAFLKSKLFLPIEDLDEDDVEKLTELLSLKLKNLEKIKISPKKLTFSILLIKIFLEEENLKPFLII